VISGLRKRKEKWEKKRNPKKEAAKRRLKRIREDLKER
jgi:hypothetical protein